MRKRSVSTQSISRLQAKLLRFAKAHRFVAENLESRLLFSSAFDVTQLTAMRATPGFTNLNGQGIGIAVLDTGVFAQNPDLQGNVKAFYDAVEDPVNAPIDPNFIQLLNPNLLHHHPVMRDQRKPRPQLHDETREQRKHRYRYKHMRQENKKHRRQIDRRK